jgi:hypothetical protein
MKRRLLRYLGLAVADQPDLIRNDGRKTSIPRGLGYLGALV